MLVNLIKKLATAAARYQHTLTPEMNVFSLGLVFAYVLSGVHPFGSTKEDRILNMKNKRAMTMTVGQLFGKLGKELDSYTRLIK